jgi:hypothetical protein
MKESPMRLRGVLPSIVAFVMLGVLWAPAAGAETDQGDVATVVERVLPAEVRRSGQAAWGEIPDGAPVYLGDSLRTGAGGRLKLIFTDKSILILAENSLLDVTEHVYDPAQRKRRSLFKLYEGKVRAIVGELFGAQSRFEIQTPVAIAGVKGSDLEIHHEKPCSTAYSHAGEVYARNVAPAVGGEVTFNAGFLTVICEGKGPTEPEEASEEFRRQLIPLRAGETVSPSQPPTDGPGKRAEGTEGPPKYPTDVLEQPTDTGGLPHEPVLPKPPEPIQNNTMYNIQ